jgi:hypothetical protein
MNNSPFGFTRPFLYVLAAAVLGAVVGYLREGTMGGALVLALAIGFGVGIAILALELWRRYS